MNKIKCECGHINPEGTVLCEACGKPIEGNQHIDGNDKKLLLNMRYEGSLGGLIFASIWAQMAWGRFWG